MANERGSTVALGSTTSTDTRADAEKLWTSSV